jgi:hypothetical protein
MNVSFSELAVQAFGFLTDAGFHIADQSDQHVEYRSANSVARVSWDRRSGELEVTFELTPGADAAGRYSLSDILAMRGFADETKYATPQVADMERLGPWLEALAADTRNHAGAALAGDRMFFRRLEVFRHSRAVDYADDMRLRHVRAEAEKAWQAGDMATFASLYTSIEKDLSQAERLKLKYARKHHSD